MILWHNPRCSKSRETIAVLQAAGHAPDIRLYLQDPPDRAELTHVLTLLGLKPSQFIRRKEAAFADLGLAQASEAQMLTAMLRHPALIERPILITKGRAAIGRPPQQVVELLA